MLPSLIPRCYICYIFGQIGQRITLKGFIRNLSQLDSFVRQVAPGVWVSQTGRVRQEFVDSSKRSGRGGGSVTHSDSPPKNQLASLDQSGPVPSCPAAECLDKRPTLGTWLLTATHGSLIFANSSRFQVFFPATFLRSIFEVKRSSRPVAVIKMFEGGSGLSGGGGAPVTTWQRLGQALRLSGWEAGATALDESTGRAHGHRSPHSLPVNVSGFHGCHHGIPRSLLRALQGVRHEGILTLRCFC